MAGRPRWRYLLRSFRFPLGCGVQILPSNASFHRFSYSRQILIIWLGDQDMSRLCGLSGLWRQTCFLQDKTAKTNLLLARQNYQDKLAFSKSKLQDKLAFSKTFCQDNLLFIKTFCLDKLAVIKTVCQFKLDHIEALLSCAGYFYPACSWLTLLKEIKSLHILLTT